jgi:hypothetical protein
MQRHIEPRDISGSVTLVARNESRTVNSRFFSLSLRVKLVSTGTRVGRSGRLVKHARYYWLLLAEGHLTRRVFRAILLRIWALPLPAG